MFVSIHIATLQALFESPKTTERDFLYDQKRNFPVGNRTIWYRTRLSLEGSKCCLRHCENKKWYGLIMKVRSDRLGLQGEDMIDILNVKSDPMLVGVLRTQPGFLPAYHMNKDQWITVCLDGSVSEQEIKNLIDVSFHLTKSKNRQQNRTNACADSDQKFC